MNLTQIDKIQKDVDEFLESLYAVKEQLIDKIEPTESSREVFASKAAILNVELIDMRYKFAKRYRVIASSVARERFISKLAKEIYFTFATSEKEMYDTRKVRKREIVLARQIHTALLHKVFGLSLQKAADIYGQNHATVHNSCAVVSGLWQTDKSFREDYEDILNVCYEYDKDFGTKKTIDFLTEN